MNATLHPALKALAVLLGYPTTELQAAIPEIRAALGTGRRIPRATREALAGLCTQLERVDPIDAQERYVELFDRGRATSLNLFEHVHGDSRDRGQAMVDLKSIYGRAGLTLASHELPDYLPTLLEFLSVQPFEVAKAMLGDSAHILRKLGEALAAQGSAYAAVPAALLAMVGERGLAVHPLPARDNPLDLEWAEEPVVFGPAAACGVSSAKPTVIQFTPRAGHADPGAPR